MKNMPDVFCRKCGSLLIQEKVTVENVKFDNGLGHEYSPDAYDNKTGKPIYYTEYKCPKVNNWLPWTWEHQHFWVIKKIKSTN